MARKKISNDEFKDKLHREVGDEYSLLQEYTGSANPIYLRHNTCGHEFKTTTSRFFTRGCRCKMCYGSVTKTQEEFCDEVKNLVGDEYIVLGEYANNNTHIKMKHNIITCQCEWDVIPSAFLGYKNRSGTRCPECYGNLLKSTETFKQEVFSLVGNEFIVIGEYKRNKVKIRMKHNIENCGREFNVLPNDFLSKGTRCSRCSGVEQKTHEEFKQEILDLVGNEYILLSEYKNNKTKVMLKHTTCGKDYMVKPNTFLSGHRCPFCSKARGERHHNWNGGSSKKRDVLHHSMEYNQWRISVFKKNKHTCQCCGGKKKLNAHHIKNFSSYVELRYDIDNGITLCEDCHSLTKVSGFHYIYGARNNTPEQLQEYIQRYKNGEFDELRNQTLI